MLTHGLKILLAVAVLTFLAILLLPIWWTITAPSGLVQNGVQQIWICGDKRTDRPWFNPIFNDVLEVMPGDQIGLWGVDERGNCDVYLHYSQKGTD